LLTCWPVITTPYTTRLLISRPLTTSGINTHVNIDLDGTGGTYSPTDIATIYNETGLDLATLITNGNLIVHT
jgi:hypothetical protein